APAVVGLVVDALGSECAARADQQSHQFVLGVVGVLVFVHQQVTNAVLPLVAHLGIGLQQLHRQGDQVVEIHRAVGAQAVLIKLVKAGDVFFARTLRH